jgi:hypothetical protein
MSTERSWREMAAGMLANERKMIPLHWPPSTGCLVQWRDRTLVGCVQHPVDAECPDVVFLSVTSKYVHSEYIAAIRELDPGRLEFTADSQLDLSGNFHVVRREGARLMRMTPDETRRMHQVLGSMQLVQVQPGAQPDTIEFKGGIHGVIAR